MFVSVLVMMRAQSHTPVNHAHLPSPQVVLPQLKTLPETVRADPTFSHAYFSAVRLLAPM